jgi:hypothetical protein
MVTKDIGALVIGVLVSFVIALAGSALLWLFLIGRTRTSSNKDALVNLMILQALVVNPLMSILVGVFVAWFAQRAAWWLAGLSLLPLLIYGVLRAESRPAEILLSIVYLLLGLASAFGASRLKSKSEPPMSHV